MSRRVTPAGVLVLPADAPRDVWLAERKNGIGASDVPRILGLTPQYGNALHVWAEKTGRYTDDTMSEPAKWGIRAEDMIARGWAEDHELKVQRLGMLAHSGHPWRRASLDRRVFGCDIGPCALQIKTRTAFASEEWRDGATPQRVEAQVQWEMLVSGFEHEHLAVLLGGNQLIERTFTADPMVQAYLIDEVTRVWECVLADVAPDVAPDASNIDLYKVMYPDRVGMVELGPDAVRWLDEYRLTRDSGSGAEKAQKAAQAALLGLLGAGEIGCIDGDPVFSYKAQDRRTTDLDRLAAEFPDAYAACVTEKSSRTFRLIEKKAS